MSIIGFAAPTLYMRPIICYATPKLDKLPIDCYKRAILYMLRMDAVTVVLSSANPCNQRRPNPFQAIDWDTPHSPLS